jgi:hypothetical protein
MILSDRRHLLRPPLIIRGCSQATSYTAGDRIFLEGSQTFTGCISLFSSNVTRSSGANPLVISSYGTHYFRVDCKSGSTTNRTAAVKISSLNGVTLQDCVLRVHSSVAETVPIGVWLENTTSTEKTDLKCNDAICWGFSNGHRELGALNSLESPKHSCS